MSRKLRIIFGPQMRDALLLDHTLFAGFVKLSIPEFYGSAGGRHFAIHQDLEWGEIEPRRRASFRLRGDPAEVGVEHHGTLDVVGEDQVVWKGALKNLLAQKMDAAHHTILLDMSGAPEFLDDYGERTYLYTESGWSQVKTLLDPHVNTDSTVAFRIGAAYPGGTVLWRIVARVDRSGKRLIGFALDRACAFALDHPHWSRGILANCRWHGLAPGHTKHVNGSIYLLNDTLDGLRERYVRDFKERPD